MACCDDCTEKENTHRTDARFWNSVIFGASLGALFLTKGGNVTAKTRKTLNIAIAGAIVAVVSDSLIRPNIKI